ncbi:hypothetical protein [Pseudactinotalea sp. Z1748]|uniref:hypothetical protein n=1 Tax=Pseudactinotalea sp. Z1748 TaxID=3413027 RepID=UPI003C7A5F05
MHTPDEALAIVRQSASQMGATDLHRFVGALTRPDGRLSLIDYALDGQVVRGQVLTGYRIQLVDLATGLPLGPSVLRRIAASFGASARDVFAAEMFTHIAQIADADLARVLSLRPRSHVQRARAVA